MVKKKRTPLEKIQTLRTKKVARSFFYFMTCGFATRRLHEKAWKRCREKNKYGFVMPYIRECFNEWKKAGFIEKSPSKLAYRITKKNCKPYFLYHYAYRLNLEPFYIYCKEKKQIDFTQKERKVLNYVMRSQVIRQDILRENPETDIITAILLYYIKHFALPYGEIEDPKEKELLNISKSSIKKDFNFEEEFRKENEEFIMDREEGNKLGKMNKKEKEKFWEVKKRKSYFLLYRKYPNEFSSINKKFKKALGII